jgi:hypothetical protein
MFEYILCQFEYGYSGIFYQEIFNGDVVRYVDESGNTLELLPPYGYFNINNNPERPVWAN